MKINLLPGLFLWTNLILFTPGAFSQEYQGESFRYRAYFEQIFGADERLVSGTLYMGATRGAIVGHPYFIDEAWKPGAILIGNTKFDGLRLKYDVAINQVILDCATAGRQNIQIGLRSGHINMIIIGDHVFIPLPHSADSTTITYAELMSDGKIKYLITKEKHLYVKKNETVYRYRETIKHYFLINDTLIPFRNRKTLFELYPDLKEEMNQFARQNMLTLGRKYPENRAKWINYFNSLIDSSK